MKFLSKAGDTLMLVGLLFFVGVTMARYSDKHHGTDYNRFEQTDRGR
jgi:hypothetical protein